MKADSWIHLVVVVVLCLLQCEILLVKRKKTKAESLLCYQLMGFLWGRARMHNTIQHTAFKQKQRDTCFGQLNKWGHFQINISIVSTVIPHSKQNGFSTIPKRQPLHSNPLKFCCLSVSIEIVSVFALFKLRQKQKCIKLQTDLILCAVHVCVFFALLFSSFY